MATFRDLVISLNPSIYWILDDVDGAVDISAHSRNGTSTGSTAVALGDTSSSPVSGCAKSTSFNGLSKTLSTSYVPFVNGTTRSLGVWVWRNSLLNRDGIWGSAGGVGGYTWIESGKAGGSAANDDDILFTPDWSVTNFIWTHGWPGAAQWVFLGWVYNETTDVAEMFVNGISVGTVTHTTAYANTTNSMELGSFADTTYLNGNLSNFFMVEGAVTATQWLSLYSSRTPGISNFVNDDFPKYILR